MHDVHGCFRKASFILSRKSSVLRFLRQVFSEQCLVDGFLLDLKCQANILSIPHLASAVYTIIRRQWNVSNNIHSQ